MLRRSPLVTSRSRATGSTTSEYLLMVAVIVVAVALVAHALVRGFAVGVGDLSRDIREILSLDDGRGMDRGGGGVGADAPPEGGSLPDGAMDDDGPAPQLPGDATAEQPPPAPPPAPPDEQGDDAGNGDQDDSADEDESDDACPYVFDEASDRWRDPETGQYVSFDAAAEAGC